MDQIKDRIKLVDTTLLSLEQVYTTLSHVSLKNMPFFVPTSYVPTSYVPTHCRLELSLRKT